ncbi:hypothetical protein VPKG_00046 [Vibrio phage pYD21-A]|uniref:hypothetical protein n=1 Tax=Vibrio phage pYD21-A TaxID=754049 RepID=UPI0002C053B0|nr:hypothetical protein VPKG_00046 [Vibrio phage pYD21-A]AGH16083.1 hypothetical protein VPKG_00046 [Vibrio phage pYD21-A]
MNFYETLISCEPNKAQIAKDVGISRQMIYLYADGALPNKKVFSKLCSLEKYEPIKQFEFEALRSQKPVGRPPIK